ncbi:MAG: hypothetical protein JWO08_3197 [Verrucomicrobiaceae bacterium]|nr:hypothetical protein [Verrucomicrobiaceae bacterium]
MSPPLAARSPPGPYATTATLLPVGPTLSTTCPLGRYNEDSACLGDLIKSGSTKYAQATDFNVNVQCTLLCDTEFPEGTWAYFANITSAGLPSSRT